MIISFFGARDSGKSSLIKALFPEIKVDFEEPIPVRNYFYKHNVIREFSGKRPDLEFLKIKSSWKIDVAVLLLDPTNKDSLSVLKSIESIWSKAWTKIVVVTKSKSATEDFLRMAKVFSEENGGTLYIIDLEDPNSLEELKNFFKKLLKEEIEEPPAQIKFIKIKEVKEIKSPKPVKRETSKNVYTFVPKKSPLAYEEFIVTARRSLDELALGLEGIDEVDLKILSMCNGYTTVDEIAKSVGISIEEVEDRVKKLRQRGFIREIRTIFKRISE